MQNFAYYKINPWEKRVIQLGGDRAPHFTNLLTVPKENSGASSPFIPRDVGELTIDRSGRFTTQFFFDVGHMAHQWPMWLYKGVQRPLFGLAIVVGYDLHQESYTSPNFDAARIDWL